MIEALRAAVDQVALALAPLMQAAGEPEKMLWLLSELGWTPDSVPQPLADLAAAGSDLLGLVGADPDATSTPDVFAAVGKLVAAIDEIRTMPDTAFPSELDVTSFKATIGADLLDYLLVEHLLSHHYGIAGPLLLAGFIRLVDQPASGLRQRYLRRQVMWNAVGEIFEDPVRGFRDAFGWDSSAPRLTAALGALGSLLEQAGLRFSYIRPADNLLAFATAGATDPAYDYLGIDVVFDTEALDTTSFAAGLRLLVLSATASRGQAMGLLPYATLTEAVDVEVADNLTLSVQGDADFTRGVALVLAPGQPVDLEAGFLGGQPTKPATIAVKLTYTPPTGEPERVLVGTADGSRLSIQGLTVSAGATLISAGKIDAFVQLDLKDALVAIKPDPGDADSFIGSLLGDQGISAQLSFGLRVSSLTGFHVTGSDGLRASLPVGVHLGPVDIQAVELGLNTGGDDVNLAIGAAVAGTIGPLSILADQLGFTVTARFPSPPTGNLGPLDVSAQFAPPSGVGLAVDAAGLTGGGFVGLDPASGRYSGVLDLHSEKFGITALGLIDTKLPEGQSGYSLLLALRATFPAIQIGFGFALTGVGGLLALNRRVDVDVLRARLAAGTAGRVLAPQDPVRNAPALLADLDAVFPIAPGITVVGPTVQLLWAELVHFDVGVFIELPGPARVVLLGSAHAEIEQDGRAYLRIRVDIVGVVDLRGETAAFDAVLIDSHLMGTLDLTGGAALRMSWGSQPYAVLSLGGFNPAYHPEPLSFPATLTRIAMVHGKPSDELYLRFEGYFAVTSNTLQFGASVEVWIHADPFTVHGSLGFDALIQFEPFHFQIDVRASVSVAYHGDTLAGLTLTGSLTGPGPVVLHAKVCIELLFFDICYSGTFTLGSSSPPPVPPVADPLDLLLAEVSNPGRLRAAGAPDPYVRLTPPDPSLTIPVVAPTGTLVWEQQRAPLDLLLTRVGGTPLPAPVQVSAASAAAATTQTDWFAPGQFTDLTDDQALTRPAYELLTSGLRLAGTGTVDGPSAQATRTTKEILLPAKPNLPDKEAIMFPAWILTSATGPPAPAVTVTTETWTVISPASERAGLTGAQARQLATMTASARAFPAADRLAAFAF